MASANSAIFPRSTTTSHGRPDTGPSVISGEALTVTNTVRKMARAELNIRFLHV